jgi:putative tryptophan/tyrosine transport system substrate-binding protein
MQFDQLRRREFITLLGSAAAAWPVAARGQQWDRMRRVGILMNLAADDPVSKARATAFAQGLQDLKWIDGQNVQIVYRWAAGKADLFDRYAAELVALAPDVIVPSGGAAVSPVLNATRTIPVVFVIAPDPVGNGYVASLSRPGGNATGFMMFEYNLAAKWVELLKEIAPNVKRVGVLRDASIHGIGQFAVIQSAAPSVGADVTPISLRDAAEIERDITALAQAGNAGLIVTAAPAAPGHRNLIIGLATRHKLPAVYVERLFALAGGLISYGTDFVDQYRRTASYIDRILKGEKPADLPVQAPTKYDLVVNLKTAKALGLDVPPTVLARADEVIE